MLRSGLLSTLRLLLLCTSSLSRSLHLSSLGTVVLGDRLGDGSLLLGVKDGDGVRQGLLGTGLALGVRATHDLDLDTQDTLAEQDVTGSTVDEVLGGLTGVDHEAVGELHGLGTSSTELARDDNLATLGTRLHDETEDTIAGTTDGQTVEELVAERLALGNGGQTTVLDLSGVEGDAVLGELEALLDQAGKLADAATLLAENLLGVGGTDDDIGDGGGNADFDAGVALLGKLTLEELVQLGVEDTVSDELSPLGTVKQTKLSVKYILARVRSIIQIIAKSERRPQDQVNFLMDHEEKGLVGIYPLLVLVLSVPHRIFILLQNCKVPTHIWVPGTAIMTQLLDDRLTVVFIWRLGWVDRFESLQGKSVCRSRVGLAVCYTMEMLLQI